jgi:uncharacterized membrane protein YesL
MFKGLFDYDNVVMRFMRKVGYLWWLNILWILTSLPVFTIGASTTALLYACTKLQKDEGTVTQNYFKSFKENFKQATGIWMIYLGIGVLIVISLIFYNRMDHSSLKILRNIMIAIAIIYAISLSYVFAIQSKFVNPVKDTIHYALVLPYQNLPETFLVLMTIGGVVILNLTTVFAVNVVTLTFGIGWIAYLLSFIYENVFDRYLDTKGKEKKRKLVR